jgi:hypothetical protein
MALLTVGADNLLPIIPLGIASDAVPYQPNQYRSIAILNDCTRYQDLQ